MRRIGIFVERQRAWGRRLCEGIASFAQERADWELTTLEREDLARQRLLETFDGFIARVYDETVAKAFRRIRKPVADVSCERTLFELRLLRLRRQAFFRRPPTSMRT